MEALFAHTYLLLFGKLAVGGLLAMAVPPFAEMERGFYKSTGAVCLLCALLMGCGELSLYSGTAGTQAGPASLTTVVAWWAFIVAFSVYYTALFIERPKIRARAFPLSVVLGFAAVAVTAVGYRPVDASSLTGIPYALSGIAGAAVAGAMLTGMLLGHWYLIDTGLDLAPLKSMLAFARWTLRFEIGAVIAGALCLWVWPGSPVHEGFALALTGRFAWLSVARVLAWSLSLLLVFLIDRTLAIPQTMAATGLFYVAALVVTVGEIISHWLLFRSGLPL